MRQHLFPANALRPDLCGQRHRAPPGQAQPPVDEPPGRADEPQIRDATVKRYHDDDHAQLRVRHAARTNGATCLTLADFLVACNFGRRLKTLGGLTPHDYISKVWTSEPERFIIDPIRQLPGPNAQACSHAGFGRLRHHRQEYPARVSERPDGLQGWRRARATRLRRRRQSPAP